MIPILAAILGIAFLVGAFRQCCLSNERTIECDFHGADQHGVSGLLHFLIGCGAIWYALVRAGIV